MIDPRYRPSFISVTFTPALVVPKLTSFGFAALVWLLTALVLSVAPPAAHAQTGGGLKAVLSIIQIILDDDSDDDADFPPGTPAPVIAISGPTGGAVLAAGMPQSLRATVSSAVPSVSFYVNGILLGVASGNDGNWSLSWTPAVPGSYTLQARALDRSGAQLAQSEPVSVTVTGASSATPVPVMVEVPQLSNGEGGTLPGEVTVSSTGTAGYSIPLQMPPGILGMVPSLALSHAGNANGGTAGLGWEISGISHIDRCGKVIATDGKGDSVRYLENRLLNNWAPVDKLCLDGSRLLLVNGASTDDFAYWADGAEYRTEIESYKRVTALVVNGKRAFKVETRDGQISYYGDTSDSYIEGAGRSDGLAHRWYLRRASDRSGNSIDYTYDENTATGESHPASISWGGNTSGTTPHFARVNFTYEVRPDVRVGYLAGSRLDERLRLKTISTSVDTSNDSAGHWSPALNYALGYSISPSSGRSLLRSVTICDGERCLPATTFNWGERDPAATQGFVPLGGPRNGPNPLTMAYESNYGMFDTALAADFNGDGRTDILERVRGPTGVHRLFESSADGTSWTVSMPLAGTDATTVLELADFDGDGRIDMLVSNAAYQWRVCYGRNRSGDRYTCEPVALPADAMVGDLRGAKLRLARDFNADGKDDLFLRTAAVPGSWYHAYQCLSNGNGFDCIEVTGSSDEKDISSDRRGEPFGPSASLDVDGDGRIDTMIIPKCAHYIPEGEKRGRWVCGTNGYGEEQGGVLALGEPERGGIRVMGGWMPFPNRQTGIAVQANMGTLVGDQNGDGYSDLVLGVLDLKFGGFISDGTGALCLSMGNGRGDCRELPSSGVMNGGDRVFMTMTVGDFDGDGVVDVLRPGSTAWNDANIVDYQLCHIGTDATASSSELPLYQRCEAWSGPTFYTKSGRQEFNGWDPFYSPASMFLGDFDGDGRQDIATLLTNGQWQIYTSVQQAKPGEALDRLVSVTNGMGNTERIEYALATDGSVYQSTVSRPDGANNVGKLIHPSWPLVKTVHRGNGAAGIRDFSYRYARLALDTTGRGSLGFAQTEQTDVRRGTTTTNWPCLSFPHMGATCASRNVGPLGVTYATTKNEWAMRTVQQANGRNTILPYLAKSTTQLKDTAGFDLGTTITTNAEPDSWGNIAETSMLSKSDANPGGWTVRKSTTFDNDATAWRLGEVTSLTETRTNAEGSIARQITYSYDSLGRLASQTRESADKTQRLVTTFDRSTTSFGLVGKNILSWTDAAGVPQARTISNVTYVSNGRFLSTSSNALGQEAQRTYDARTGVPTSVKSSDGLTTSTVADGFSRVGSTTGPDGTIVRTSYRNCASNCPAGAGMVTITEALRAGGVRTAPPVLQFSDQTGRPVRKISWGFGGEKVAEDTVYDYLGRLSKTYWPRFVSDPEALSAISLAPAGVLRTLSDYDALDRPWVLQSVDESGVTQSTMYNWRGLTKETINPKRQQISETRDVWGRLESAVDAHQKTTSFRFDAFGNLVQTTDPLGNVVKVGYDTWGRKISLQDPDLGLITYDVDPLGQTWRQVSPRERAKGTQTVMAFDALGRMTERTSEDARAVWTYDILPGQASCAAAHSCGKLVRTATLAGGSTLDYRQDFTYDSLGRADSTTRYLDVPYTERTSYDAWGRVSAQQYQRGSDAVKTFALRYNAWGDLAGIEHDGRTLWTAIAKDAAARLTNAKLGNGLSLTRSFNPHTGRLFDGTVTAGNVVRLHEAYQFDVLGNVSQRLQEWDATRFIENFDYDGLNRLKWTQIVGFGEQVFTFDEIGNLRSKTGVGAGDYVYPGAGAARPHAVSAIPGIGSFFYDDNGNMTAGAGRSMTWTSFDMPVTITKGGETSAFWYGPNRERIKQVRLDGTTIWYAGAMEVESHGGSTKVKTYLPGGVGVSIESAGTTKVYYTHTDRLGSVMALSDEAGVLSEQLAYDTWGKRREQATPSTPDGIDGQIDNKGYTGHEMLDKLDLVHMNGRVYDPLVARFVSADAIIQDPEHSQSYNRYSYVWNNPTNLTDPSGFLAQDQSVLPVPTEEIKPKCDQECQVKRRLEETQNRLMGWQVRYSGSANSGTSWYDNPGLTGAASSQKAAERRASYWSAFFGGEYSVMDPDGLAGHQQGETFSMAVDGAAVAAPFLKGFGLLRGARAAIIAESAAGISAEAAAAGMSPLLTRYLSASGGRWGSNATRLQNHELASALESSGYTIRGGAGRAAEEWFAGPGGGTRGGTFVDITATRAGETVRIQTITTLRDGVTPTAAEAAAAARIQARFPNDQLLLIPKK